MTAIFVFDGKVNGVTAAKLSVDNYCEIFSVKKPQYEIVKRAGGKPALFPAFLEFNVTHSGRYTLCAVSQSAVGIDLERKRDVDFRAVAQRLFPSTQCNSAEEFFSLWTTREATAKLFGISVLAEPEDSCKVTSCDVFDGYSLSVACDDEFFFVRAAINDLV